MTEENMWVFKQLLNERWNSRAIGMMAPLFAVMTFVSYIVVLPFYESNNYYYISMYRILIPLLIIINFLLSSTLMGKLSQKIQFFGFIFEVLLFSITFLMDGIFAGYIDYVDSFKEGLLWFLLTIIIIIIAYLIGLFVSWRLMKRGVFSKKSKGILRSLYSLDKYLSGFTFAGILIVPPIVKFISGSFVDLETLFMTSLIIFVGSLIIFFAGTMTLTAIAKFKYESFNPPMIQKEKKKKN